MVKGIDRRTQIVLAQTPTWAIEEELAKRRWVPNDRLLRLPGLVVDPVGIRVVWRGESYDVTGRMMEIVYELALSKKSGYYRIPAKHVCVKVWGAGDEAALANFRCTVLYIRRRLPGLLLPSDGKAGYGLDVPEEAEASEWRAA